MGIGSFGVIASLIALIAGVLVYWTARVTVGMRWYWNAPGAILVSLCVFFVAWDLAALSGLLSGDLKDTSKAALNTLVFAVGWYVTAYQLPLFLKERRKS